MKTFEVLLRTTRVTACVLALSTVGAPATSARAASGVHPSQPDAEPLVELGIATGVQLPVVEDLSSVLRAAQPRTGKPHGGPPGGQHGSEVALAPPFTERSSSLPALRRPDPPTVTRGARDWRQPSGRRDAVGKRPAFTGGTSGAPPPAPGPGADPRASEQAATDLAVSLPEQDQSFPASTPGRGHALKGALFVALALGLGLLFAGAWARSLQ